MHDNEIPEEHFAEIERAVELLNNFYQTNKQIEIVESENQKKIIAYKKEWWSSKKNVVNTINITYLNCELPQILPEFYDELNIELGGEGKSIIINNGLANNYSITMEKQAQVNLKTMVSGTDYIKALVFVIDKLTEKKKILSLILKKR